MARAGALAAGTPAWVPALWAAPGLCLLAGRRRWAGAGVLAASGVSLFFRDPDRTPAGAGLLAAADGVVKSVDALPDGRTRVATYMSLRDVHVNRAPAAGAVVRMEHRDGGYLPAFRKESERNERLVWLMDTALGQVESRADRRHAGPADRALPEGGRPHGPR